MTGAVLSPALPALRAAFGAGAEAWARWVLTTPALFVALGAPLAGVLTDRVGRRPVLIGALILFGVGGSVGGVLGALPAIVASRAVLGLAAGGVGTVATTLIVDYFDEEQSRVLGGQAAVMAIAAMAYTVLGGALAELSWRAPFGVYLLGLAVVGPAAVLLPEPEASSTVDADASEPSSTGGVPWVRVGLLYGLAFVGLAVFNLVRVELPYYLRAMGLQSGVGIAAVLSAGTVSGAGASLAYDRVRARLGTRGTIALLLGLFAGGFGVVAAAPSPAVVFGGVVLAGGGMGLFVPALTDGVGRLAAESVRGRLLGGLSTLRNLGRFASPLLAQPAVVGAAPAAPFVGGALLTGGLSAAVLLWGAVRLVRSTTGPCGAMVPPGPHVAVEGAKPCLQ
jgi:MFS family permease